MNQLRSLYVALWVTLLVIFINALLTVNDVSPFKSLFTDGL